ncbi:MAG: hypothetical protein KC502_17825 [Myxococcales bacterium]|nr:hypothetical protein [Myxococcales bacterium]
MCRVPVDHGPLLARGPSLTFEPASAPSRILLESKWSPQISLLATTSVPSDYDPAAELFRVSGRTTADALTSLQWAAIGGATLWLLLAALILWAAWRLREALSARHGAALAIWMTALTAWGLGHARHFPIQSGDELVDYTQSVFGVVTGLRPVELIFATGWTQLVSLMMAPWVWLNLPASASSPENQLISAIFDAAPGGLLISRWLSTGALLGLAALWGASLSLRVGAAAGIAAIGVLATSPSLQPLAAQCSPHAFALALCWVAIWLAATATPKLAEPGGTEAPTPINIATAERPRWLVWLVIGLLTGYAVGSHGLAVILLAAALPLWWRHRRGLHIIFAGGTAGVGLSNPHIVEQWPVYVANARFRLAEVGATEAVPDAATVDYVAHVVAHPLVVVGLGMLLIAAVMDPRHRSWDRMGPVATGLTMLLLLMLMRTQFDRYFAWALPGLVWGAALGIGAVVQQVASTRLDAGAAGAIAALLLHLTPPFDNARACPAGVEAQHPLTDIAVHRATQPILFVTPLPQLNRAVTSGLLSPALATAVTSEFASRLGGRAQVELRAYPQHQPLPASFVALPGGATPTHRQLWELRWRRAMPLGAPLRVSGRAPLSTIHASAACGMLLRGAVLRAEAPADSAEDVKTLPGQATQTHRETAP